MPTMVPVMVTVPMPTALIVVGVWRPIVGRGTVIGRRGSIGPAAAQERDGIGDNALPPAAVVMMSVVAVTRLGRRADQGQPRHCGSDDCDFLHLFRFPSGCYLVREAGFEPAFSCSQSRRITRLSYSRVDFTASQSYNAFIYFLKPHVKMVDSERIELSLAD